MFHSQELRTIEEDAASSIYAESIVGNNNNNHVNTNSYNDGRLRAEQLQALEEANNKILNNTQGRRAVSEAGSTKAVLNIDASSVISDAGVIDTNRTVKSDEAQRGTGSDNNNNRNRIDSTDPVKEGIGDKARDGKSKRMSKSRKDKIIFVATFTFVVITALVVGFIFIGKKIQADANSGRPLDDSFPNSGGGNDENGDGISNTTTSSSSPKYVQQIIDNLKSVTDVETLENDPNSPQYKAREWLTDKDNELSQPVPVERLFQRYALVVLYFATEGEDWKTPTGRRRGFLNTNTDECTWSGIECQKDGEISRVNQIDLADTDLGGKIPSELGLLKFAQEIRLERNHIAGTLPETLKQLSSLYYFDVSENQITGEIPGQFWTLQLLRFIFLYGNRLSGPIYNHENQENSKLLEQIWLHNNKLTGTVPRWIGELSNLDSLILFNNNLSGSLQDFLPVSPSLSSNPWSRLSYLDVSSNQLEGTIPSTLFSNQVYNGLQHLYLHENKINGTLPNGDEPSNLRQLWLQANELQGTIPDGFGAQWFYLRELLLHENDNLTGRLSACRNRPNSVGRVPAFYWPSIERLELDCQKVTCPCCTDCKNSTEN